MVRPSVLHQLSAVEDVVVVESRVGDVERGSVLFQLGFHSFSEKEVKRVGGGQRRRGGSVDESCEFFCWWVVSLRFFLFFEKYFSEKEVFLLFSEEYGNPQELLRNYFAGSWFQPFEGGPI